MILLVDNYDSFTYNLVHYLRVLGQSVHVIRNDALSLEELIDIQPSHIVLSPGPGSPQDAGICCSLVQACYTQYPILGVCLGHQCIAQSFGARIIQATRIVHGEATSLIHDGAGLFSDCPAQFSVARYHSLVVSADKHTFPSALRAIAWSTEPCGQKTIMALRHMYYPVFGVQYHPESVLSEYGYHVLGNFIRLGVTRR